MNLAKYSRQHDPLVHFALDFPCVSHKSTIAGVVVSVPVTVLPMFFVLTAPNRSSGGQKLEQPMSERLVTVSDISGRMQRCAVEDIQEIIIPPFIFHVAFCQQECVALGKHGSYL